MSATVAPASAHGTTAGHLHYTQYQSEVELPIIASLIEKELSEPYIVYTYRYFLQQWPQLCWLAWESPSTTAAAAVATAATTTDTSLPGTGAHRGDVPVGVVVCKLDRHLKGERNMRGYIAMLSVRPDCRGRGIATQLVRKALESMRPLGAQEVVLETEVDNVASLALYARLGFIREKRLHRFYLNGKDCFRLVLPLPPSRPSRPQQEQEQHVLEQYG